jgi:hypothetical protein
MKTVVMLFVLALFALFAIAFSGCAIDRQQGAINNARFAVAAVGAGSKVAEDVVYTMYSDDDPSDEKSYCRNKIASLAFKQIEIILDDAADAILAWEESLMLYLAHKDAGVETDAEWTNVGLASVSWRSVLSRVIASAEGIIDTLRLWGVHVPKEVTYAWGLVSTLSEGAELEDFEFDFDDLEVSICITYLPGK